MANKKINQLDTRTGAALTDLSLVGDPASGTSFKLTIQQLSTLMGVPGKFNQPTGTIAQYIRGDGSLATFPTIPSGTVTSVGLTMPSAFSVANSPITSSGTLAVTGAGTSAQYVRGDGQLANFPDNGGGGSSVNYYLNGSVNQGTFGGDTYYEMSKTPVLGAGTNFTRTNGQGNGYIASFITDAGDPSLLNIPGGNWNLEFYFQSSASGGNPQFYAELYKVNASNVFTLVASGSTNPEGITNGTTVDQYFTSIPVPQTSLLVTDRLAVRIYVITSGRTITLHTENNNLCEVLTTFSTGLNALNGLTAQVQYFATGTSGTDFAISSATDTHTFNLPTASATNRGALSSADWSTFSGKVGGSGATGQVAYWNGTNSQTGSNNLFWNAANSRLGIGTTSPQTNLHVSTAGSVSGRFSNTTSGVNTEIGVISGLGYVGTQSAANFAIITSDTERARFFTTGNFNIGGTTDGGQRLQVQGTTLLAGAVTMNGSVTGTGNTSNYTVTASSNLARSKAIISTLISLANNDTLIGLDINPTFSTGSFTGINRLSLRSNGISIFGNSATGTASGRADLGVTINSFIDNSAIAVTSQTGNSFHIENTAQLNNVYANFSMRVDNGGNGLYSNIVLFKSAASTGSLRTYIQGSHYMSLFSTGNLLLQNGGTHTDAGFRLDVNGTARVSGSLTVDTNTLFVDATNDRVGIGTTSPVSLLNLNNGDAWINVISQLRGLQFGFAGPTHGSYRAAVMGGPESYGSTDSGMLTFHTQNGYVISAIPPERMRITSAGNLLVGTTTDNGNRLQISGSATFSSNITAGLTSAIGTQLTLNAAYSNGITFINTNNAVDNRNFRIISDISTYGDFQIQKSTTVGGSTYTNLLTFAMSNEATFSSSVIATSFIPNNSSIPTNGMYLPSANTLAFATNSAGNRIRITSTGSILVGTSTDVSSSIFTIVSTTKGFLPPKMTTTEKNAISSPAAGLQVYDTALNQMSYYNGTTWVNF